MGGVSSTNWSANSYRSSGLSGLVSGMDTDSMVEKMLQGTQSKIDKQNAAKQQLEWKQSIYHSVISKINALKGKYFDSSYDAEISGNLLNGKFFNSMLSNVKSGDSVRVESTSPSAFTGDMSVLVKQLASASKLTSSAKMSSNTIIGDVLDVAKIQEALSNDKELSFDLTLDGITKSITFSKEDFPNGYTSDKIEGVLDNKLSLAFGGYVTADVISDSTGDKLSFSINVGQESGHKLTITGTDEVASKSGAKMSTDTINGDAMDVAAIEEALSNDKELSFDLTLDGITKSITFSKEDFPDGYTSDKIEGVLDNKLSRAFGGYVTADVMGDKLSFSINFGQESGHELKITGADAVKFGIEPGASTLLQTSTKLGDIAGISGKGYSFTINGEKFSFGADDTVGNMISTINSSNAGVQIAYSSATDSFSLTASSTGAQYGITLTQEYGNLLTVMFGSDKITAGALATSRALNGGEVAGTGLKDGYTTKGASMSFKVNGKNYTFTLKELESGEYTKDEIEKGFNDWLSSTFGKTGDKANIEYKDGNLKTAAGYLVSFEKTKVTDANELERMGKLDLAIAMGFAQTGATNAVTGDMSVSQLADISDPNNKFELLDSTGKTATTLSDITQIKYVETGSEKICSVKFVDGKFKLTNETNITSDITFEDSWLVTYFGDKVTFGTGAMDKSKVDAGTDAEVVINGVATSRSSNTFTFDGITMTATKVGTEETVIGTVRDTDKIVDTVKSFVEDYNKLVDELYGKISEDADYRDYAPLTSAQKKEMTDDEIEKWTEKAKTGLVRGDNDISSFLQAVRSAFYTKVESAGVAAYSIGIETTANSLSGKISINEALLRKTIASSPDTVEKLFTDPENGLATQLNRTCEEYAKMSMAKPGVFVRKAGAEGYTAYSKMNDMYNELSRINDKLKDLQNRYEKERTRYWNKFSAMESVIAMYSSQSSMITSSFSSDN